jgi:hypothetical protein
VAAHAPSAQLVAEGQSSLEAHGAGAAASCSTIAEQPAVVVLATASTRGKKRLIDDDSATFTQVHRKRGGVVVRPGRPGRADFSGAFAEQKRRAVAAATALCFV